MKAIVCGKYGPPDVLQLQEINRPEPMDDEILIKIEASSINSADHRTMRAKPFFVRFMGEGFLKPKKSIPGIDMAGVVEMAGRNVTKFKPGDEVFGDIYDSKTGAYAEYVCIKETGNIVKKPASVSFEQVAAVPVAGLTALQALRDHGKIKKGQKVLINGASGGVGTYCVVLAKFFGTEVTGVCSTRNVDLIKSIGADHVIDYSKEDCTMNGKKYDLVIDIAANINVSGYKRILKSGGKGILVGFSTIMHMAGIGIKGGKANKKHGIEVKAMGMARANRSDLEYLGGLLESGGIQSVIDKVYPLEATSEAMRYFEDEHARAKVIIKI